jgi:hypothetical protein
MKIILIFFLCLAVLIPQQSSSQETNEIFITLSDQMTDVVFDGKWSFFTEWKRSSLDSFNEDTIKIRTAHQENFVYIFIDVLSDTTIDNYNDKATICFDTNNDKSIFPDENDYCFVAELGNKNGSIFRGTDKINKDYFEKISHQSGFIGIGNASDENDRYSKTPHPSYEFKIPTELIGRSNTYGIYFEIYDASINKIYSWPEEITEKNVEKISSPNRWGNMISPDKSLPEFELPLLILLPVLTMIILVTKIRREFSMI